MTKYVVIGLIVSFILVAAAINLTRGPSTEEAVCASFAELGDRLRNANGLFDNAVFRQADDLADVAGRFDGPPDLSTDAQALARIADSNSTNTLELALATQQIARLCGRRL